MKRADKRALLLKAARDCFARYGYDKTTLEDIGKSLGLNKASLYYYFKNKDEIFVQVVLEEAELFIQSLQKEVAGIDELEQKLISYLVGRLLYYHQVLNLHQLTVDQLQAVQPRWQEVYEIVLRREEDFVQSLLEDADDAGLIDTRESLRDVATSLLAVSIALKHNAVKEHQQHMAGDFDYSEAEHKISTLVRLVCKGLRP